VSAPKPPTDLLPIDGRPADRPSRPKPSSLTTRRKAAFWDRIKIVLFFLVCWLALLWSKGSQFPEIPLVDLLRIAARDYGWLLALAGLEVIRQLHYLLEEHSPRYYAFWTKKIFRSDRHRGGRDEWTRFRTARAAKLVLFLVILDMLLAAAFQLPVATALIQLPVLVFKALPFIFQLAFGFFFVMVQFIGLFWFLSRGGIDTYFPDDIETRFTDVKGQDAVLDRVKENIIFLEDPESIEDKGGYVPAGILLWGPPGTGKTLMAQAVAGETGRPFVFVDPGAFINMFMGVGILKVKSLYRKLRKLALRYGGVIVFFDEADSLGNRGALSGGGGGGWSLEPDGPWTTGPACNGMGYLSAGSRRDVLLTSLGTALPPGAQKAGIIAGLGGMGGSPGTLQALLSEMSGLKKPRGFFNRVVRRLLGMKPKPPPKYRILHMFATNMPQALDEAMLRPGRIDRIYKVGYPHKDGRKATLLYYLDKVPNGLTDEQVDKLATISPYATGASIQDMVNEGLVIAIRDGRDTVAYADLIKAKHLKEHGLPDDHEYIERERHSVAVHEACHAVVAYRLRKHAVIDVATIERRGDVGGFVASIPPEERFVDWKSEREIDVMTFLASLAGERLFYDGDNSAGVGGDMRGATSIVTLMEGVHAMGDTIGSRWVTMAPAGSQPILDGTDRQMLDGEFGKRVETRLKELYDRTWELLEGNRTEVLAVAHALEVKKTVTGDDVAAVIDGGVGPFVDGRQYQDPALVTKLEAYHAASLAAHKAHSEVEGALPALVPPPPAGSLGNGEAVPDGHPAAVPPSPPVPSD
jgi:cell division protease FtsH